MTPALQDIIHEDQKGFLPNRHIAANIRRILDITVSAEEEGKEGIILSCDYMKCFDRIETDAVIGAMKAFKFSEILQRYVKMIYNQFTVKVQNNGNFSEKIDVQRSVRQGGPASNALFLTVAELLAICIREDKEIKGLSFKEVLHLLNQYADDMDVAMENDQETLDRVLQHIHDFHYHTGFLLSYEKTTIYRVGSLRKSDTKLYTEADIRWTSDSINVLGVDIHADEKKLMQLNYQKVTDRVDDILKLWSKRQLSLLGKVNIINTLIGSLFVYKMAVLPKLPESYIKQLNAKMNNFLWNGHRPKIPLRVLQSDKHDGGVKLIDFE